MFYKSIYHLATPKEATLANQKINQNEGCHNSSLLCTHCDFIGDQGLHGNKFLPSHIFMHAIVLGSV